MFIPIVFLQVDMTHVYSRWFFYLPVKNNGNKHVSYLPVKKPMGINMCYIYLLKKNALHTTELVNIEFDLFLSY
jgi:hypothetical protein